MTASLQIAFAKSVLVAFAAAILSAPPAHSQDAVTLLAQGKQAADSGHFEEALRLADGALSSDQNLAAAHHLVAWVHLQEPHVDPGKARDAIGKAIALEPDNTEYLGTRLRLMHRFPSSFLPAWRTAQREDLAEKILKLDPDHAYANKVLGEIAVDDYLNARASVSFPDLDNLDVSAGREAFFNAAYLLEPAMLSDDGALAFEATGRLRSNRIEFVVKESEATRRYEKAVTHLSKALQSGHVDPVTVRELMMVLVLRPDIAMARDVIDRLVAANSSRPDLWLYKGYIDFRENRLAAAEASFRTAFELLPEGDVAVFESTARFGEESLAYSSDEFWRRRDPMHLTNQNERQLEHYSRLVYADLRFGDMFEGQRGWDTEPGDVVVRYGLPLGEAQNNTRLDKYLVLHYGDFFFKFMDLAKSGKLTFYSPKAGNAAPDFDQIQLAYDNDFTLVSKRIFRRTPERFIYDRHGSRVAFPLLASRFRDDGGGQEVVAAFGVPWSDNREDFRSGLFALDSSGLVLGRETGSKPGSSFLVSHENTRYRLLVRSMMVAPGTRSIAVEFEADESGAAGVQRINFSPLQDVAAAPVLSDLLLAYLAEESTENTELLLVRGGHAIQPAPWGVFGVGQPVYLYFETYGIQEQGSGEGTVEVEARLYPHRKGQRLDDALGDMLRDPEGEGVAVRYVGVARAGKDARYLIIDTEGLREGTYVLGLRLTDLGTGGVARTGRVIVLE